MVGDGEVLPGGEGGVQWLVVLHLELIQVISIMSPPAELAHYDLRA